MSSDRERFDQIVEACGDVIFTILATALTFTRFVVYMAHASAAQLEKTIAPQSEKL